MTLQTVTDTPLQTPKAVAMVTGCCPWQQDGERTWDPNGSYGNGSDHVTSRPDADRGWIIPLGIWEMFRSWGIFPVGLLVFLSTVWSMTA